MTPPVASGALGSQPKAASLSFDAKWLVLALCVALISYLAIVPLGFLLWQSFFTPHTAAKAAEFTFQNYIRAYSSMETVRLLWNSVLFSIGTALFSLIIGTALAWMNERTNTPFKRLFFGLALVPLIIPGILFTVSWIMLGSPKIGIFNLWLQRLFDTDYVFFNVYTIWGMIWVDGLHYSPMAFLLMTAAFRSMDPALEESAAMSGAGIFQVVRRITLALSWPAICATVLILFVRPSSPSRCRPCSGCRRESSFSPRLFTKRSIATRARSDSRRRTESRCSRSRWPASTSSRAWPPTATATRR